ncbi:Riboflavin synthase alpha chain [Dimargaris xerosporica]|nr:Riboflavin synthase alpha chain [Dimargaris xerosporica]
MFTGIVETIGRVDQLVIPKTFGPGQQGATLSIADASSVLTDCQVGDSICVNGTCLTVTDFTSDRFTVGLSPETLRRTNLGKLQTGAAVNLERAMGVGTRFGGHFVQGHVDTPGTLVAKIPEGDSLWLRIAPKDPTMLKNIVPKGYIAVDGTSLTVCEVNDVEGWFSLMLVAYTQSHVILPQKAVGDEVNLEVDMLGKYVERIVEYTLHDNKVKKTIESAVRKTLQRPQ